MIKTKRGDITIIHGSEYAIIKGRTNSDMKVLIRVINGICNNAVAVSTIATVMECMTEIIRGKSTVCDSETGTDESMISVHVDVTDIIISFTGFQVKSENL